MVKKLLSSCRSLPEYTVILYPDENGVYLPITYPLRGALPGGNLMSAISGTGKAPSHIIRQRGPFQDGSTPIDMRWDERGLEISIQKSLFSRTAYWDRRWDVIDWLRPNRAFDPARTEVQPLILRHYLPGGKIERGHDLVLEAGSQVVTSLTGHFVHWGLLAGELFTITDSLADDGNYRAVEVPNDYTVILDSPMTNDETGITWKYRRAQSYRDLRMLLEDGPGFNEPAMVQPHGFEDTLTFTADDPFWYGPEQSESWAIEDALGDLVFDLAGAWFGPTPGVGRWLFAPNFVGETVQLIYWGHEGALPIIQLTGPATNPAISNSTLGVTLTLSYTISAGETVTIDTLNQIVKNNLGDNLFGYLNGDVANFAISPNPQAPQRINNITLSFSGGVAGQSEGTLLWRSRYASL